MEEQLNPEIIVRPLHGAVPLNGSETTDVLVRIVTPEKPSGWQSHRPTLNLALVIDRSGSMSGAKIERAKEAAAACVTNLMGRDRVSVVTFDDHVSTHVAGARVENRSAILDGIRRIDVGGSTALCDGWRRGASEARAVLESQSVNRVLLITDGQANVGETDPRAICRMVTEAAQSGVTTSTIGIGSDYNEELLIPMAEAGRGNASHVADSAQLKGIVERELHGLAELFGRDARLGIEPAESVEIVEVLNDLPTGRKGRLNLGDLTFGTPFDVVVRVRVTGGPIGVRNLFAVRLSWSPSGERNDARRRMRHAFEAEVVREGEIATRSIDSDVLVAGELLRAARARNRAIEHLDLEGRHGEPGVQRAVRTIELALERLELMLANHLEHPDVSIERRALVRVIGELRQRDDLPGARKRMRYEAHAAMHSRRPEDVEF